MKTDSTGLPIIDQYSEECFVDCVLRITKLAEDEQHYRMELSGSYQGTPVGMAVLVRKDIKAGFDKNMNLIKDHVYRKGVRFIRSGAESDRLISALAKRYGQASQNLKMVEEETFTAIALYEGEIDMRRSPVKLKIFGRDSDTDPEDRYYESFFNVDLENRLIFWNEKDQEYRRPLIRGLSK